MNKILTIEIKNKIISKIISYSKQRWLIEVSFENKIMNKNYYLIQFNINIL